MLQIFFIFTIFLTVWCHDSTLLTQCPRGYYQSPSSVTVTRMGDCKPCPRGRYGATEGLINSGCTAGCPVGKYNDKVAAESPDDCKFVRIFVLMICMLVKYCLL